jgi:FixJ family two-component response regulator
VTAERLIAIVEDDGPLRLALVGLLRSSGFIVYGFESAEEFLLAISIQHFVCIITDIQLPGLSGIDLKFELLARQCLQPVIMITARNDPELENRAFSSGAVRFLRKPFDGNELIKAVYHVLGEKGKPAE